MIKNNLETWCIENGRAELLEQWDYEKNKGLLPAEVSIGQTKSVYWICPKGHSYPARIDHRCSMKSGCPYCNHKKVIPGENDLAALYPEIAAEWDKDNNDKSPSEYFPFSNKPVNWICPICRKSYVKRICDRTLSHTGCPYCTKPGERSTSQQEQSFVYYYSKITAVQSRARVFGKEIDIYLPQINAGIEYNGEYYHSKRAKQDAEKKVYFAANGIRLITVKCGRKRENYEDVIVMETPLKANPSLLELTWAIKESFKLLSLSAPEIDLKRDTSEIYALYIHSIKQNNISTKYPDIAKEWSVKLNKGLTPDMFAYASNKTVWWTCSTCNNDYDMKISNRTLNKMNCPYCSGKRIKVGFNDLMTTHPDLAEEWNAQKNSESPQEFSKGSDRKVWWKCKKCGHEWPSTISSRVAGSDCPACAGRTVIAGYNDLETAVPDAAKLWNYKKNISRPTDYTKMSNNSVWWLCPDCGHEWKAVISDISSGKRCPKCAIKKRVIGRNKTYIVNKGSLKDNDPELLAEWIYERNDKRPEDVLAGSHDSEIWWKCQICGNEWQTSPYCRAVMKHGCPKCNAKRASDSRRKKVRNLDTGEIFSYCSEAGRSVGVSDSAITYACRKGTLCKGFHWKYVE